MLLRIDRNKAGQVVTFCKSQRIHCCFAPLVFACCFLISANAFSQGITLSLTNVPLETVFKEIEKQSAYRFVYTREQLEMSSAVTIQVKNESIQQVLAISFSNQPLTYVVSEKHIIVRIKEQEPRQKPAPVKPGDIRGRILNEKGEPLPGTSIRVKGTNIGAFTDDEGAFVIKELSPNVTLIITRVGYESEEIELKGRVYLVVHLKLFVSSLDETIIKGYYSTSRRLNTGSVSKITAEEINRQPVSNPLATLQGRAPGVFINTQNGLPGGNFTIQIRGRSSINSGTDPLYIIDGVPFSATPLNATLSTLSDGINGATSPLNSINPGDIESIEILKDADATAIYGSRAANGVILITTRKGMAGKTKMELDVYTGFSRLANFPRMLNIQQYLELRKEGFANSGITPTISNAPDLFLWDTTRSINWPKYMLGGSAATTHAQMSLSGGNSNTTFRISGNYRREGTIMRRDQHYQRAGAHVLLQHTSSNKKFSIDFSSNYTADDNHQLASSIFGIFTLAPNIPLYDSMGNYSWAGINSSHPEAVLGQKSTSKTGCLLANTSMRMVIFPGWMVKAHLGYTRSALDQVMIYPKLSLNPNTGGSSYAYYGNNKIETAIIEPQVEYSKSIKGSAFQVLAGLSWQQTTSSGSLITGTAYSNDDLLEFYGAAGFISAANHYSQYKYASIFGRLHYDYQKKYIVNLSIRRDGSSRFGPGSRFGNFGSVGAGWVFSEEKFLRRSNLLSYAKLRGSWGITGNDLISDYQYLSTYSTTGLYYDDVPGLAPARIANDEFRWESNRKLELALELGFLKNRLFLTAAFYRNKSGNQLIDYPLPYTSGPFGNYQSNLPAVVLNQGMELDLSFTIIKKAKFYWVLTGNLTVPENKLLKYPGLEASSFANTYVIGQDLSIRKSLKFTGVNQQNGLPEFRDVNGDGFISSPEDNLIVGRTSPYYFGGIGSEIKLYGFQLTAFFQFSRQFAQGLATIPGTRSNKFILAMERWQKPGDHSAIPAATVSPSGEYFNLALSDAAFFNASYLRLKNISLTYTFSESILKKIKLSDLRLYCEGQNLLTWQKKAALYDPESANAGIAPLKTIAFGFRLTL